MNDVLEQTLKYLEMVGIVSRLPAQVSSNFGSHLIKKYPWTVSRINWAEIDHSFRRDLEDVTEDQLLELLNISVLGVHKHVCLVYSPTIRGVLVRSSELVAYFDDLTFPVQHVYFFGVDVTNDNKHSYYFDHFLELYHMKLSGIVRS